MKLFRFLAVLLLALCAADAAVTVFKVRGEVNAASQQGERPLLAGMALEPGERVITAAASQAALRWPDNTTVVIGPGSTLLIETADKVAQERGEGYFWVNALKKATSAINGVADPHFSVQTKTATIGIRGTEFIVRSDDDAEAVFLKSGAVEVSALEGEFEHFKTKAARGIEAELNAFEAFKSGQNKAFETHKKKLEAEFQAYVKSVTLQAGTGLTLKGAQATEEPLSAETLKAFDRYRDFLTAPGGDHPAGF